MSRVHARTLDTRIQIGFTWPLGTFTFDAIDQYVRGHASAFTTSYWRRKRRSIVGGRTSLGFSPHPTQVAANVSAPVFRASSCSSTTSLAHFTSTGSSALVSLGIGSQPTTARTPDESSATVDNSRQGTSRSSGIVNETLTGSSARTGLPSSSAGVNSHRPAARRTLLVNRSCELNSTVADGIGVPLSDRTSRR